MAIGPGSKIPGWHFGQLYDPLYSPGGSTVLGGGLRSLIASSWFSCQFAAAVVGSSNAAAARLRRAARHSTTEARRLLRRKGASQVCLPQQYSYICYRSSSIRILLILRLLEIYEIYATNFNFYTIEFWHIEVLHFYKVQNGRHFSDLFIIIQEPIYVRYQQSK